MTQLDRRTLLSFAAASAVGACQTTTGEPSQLAQQVRDARAASPAPALGAVVVLSSGPIETAQDGVTRIDAPAPLDRHARFNIGSNAKSMLATLAATFVRDGALRWDTRVEEVFTAEAASLDPTLRTATLTQLLAHRSGLPAYSSGAELSSVQATGDTPLAQRLSFALQALRGAPTQPPGQSFLYSNAGYVAAGVMLERIAGQPTEALMRERVFTPLRMSHATFGDAAASEAGQPLGHYLHNGAQAVYLESEPAIPAFLTPAGDVSLTLEDYGRYLREHLCGLRGEPTRILSAETIQFLHHSQGDDGASLGWGAYAFDGVPASIHVGGTGAFSAFVAVLPSRDFAVATVVNSGAPDSRSAALTLMQTIVSTRLVN